MSFLRDTMLLSGAALSLWGLAQWSVPLAFVAGGLSLVSLAVAWSLAAGRKA